MHMKKFYFVACSGSDMDSKMAAEFKQKNKNAYVPAKDGGKYEFHDERLFALSEATDVQIIVSHGFESSDELLTYAVITAAKLAKDSDLNCEVTFESRKERSKFAPWLISVPAIEKYMEYYPYVRSASGAVDYREAEPVDAVRALANFAKRLMGKTLFTDEYVRNAMDDYYMAENGEGRVPEAVEKYFAATAREHVKEEDKSGAKDFDFERWMEEAIKRGSKQESDDVEDLFDEDDLFDEEEDDFEDLFDEEEDEEEDAEELRKKLAEQRAALLERLKKLNNSDDDRRKQENGGDDGED